ncbi:hypothetical protein ABBQ38_000574 [Trebouxia sp. C0009 RCD-2024]
MKLYSSNIVVCRSIANRTLRVLASRSMQPHAVQFDKQNTSSVAKGLRTISAVLQTVFGADFSPTRCDRICRRYPPLSVLCRSVIPGLPSAEELPKDRAEQLGVTFNKLQVQFLQDHGPFIYISMMGVRPDMQRQGLGGLLLAAMCSVADEERKWCYLEATHAGIGLYQKHGFVVVCTSQIGPEAPVMQHMGRPPQ